MATENHFACEHCFSAEFALWNAPNVHSNVSLVFFLCRTWFLDNERSVFALQPVVLGLVLPVRRLPSDLDAKFISCGKQIYYCVRNEKPVSSLFVEV